MYKPLTYLASLSLVLTSLAAGSSLTAQTAQVRAKVDAKLPGYQPAVRIKGGVIVAGSDALADLGDEWNKGFQKFHPEGRLVYQAKLSKDAILGLAEGTTQLIISAREMTSEETKAFVTKFGYQPMRIPVCLDANIVFVHKDNPITSITVEQLDAIYSKSRLGGIKTQAVHWGDVGVRGDLAKQVINAYSRAEGTATRLAFADQVMHKGEFRTGINDRDDSSSLAEAVLTDRAAIAYGPLSSWYTANKVLPVVPEKGNDARLPTQENVTSGRYPMTRLIYAYLNRAPGKPLDPGVNEVIHYLLANEGQSNAAEVGLLPGPVEFITIALKRLNR